VRGQFSGELAHVEDSFWFGIKQQEPKFNASAPAVFMA
jgi:hypothetical protein